MGAPAGSGPSFMSGVQVRSLKAVSSGALAAPFATAIPATNETAPRPMAAVEIASRVFLVMRSPLSAESERQCALRPTIRLHPFVTNKTCAWDPRPFGQAWALTAVWFDPRETGRYGPRHSP